MQAKEKANIISDQILSSSGFGIKLEFDSKTLTGMKYQLLLKEDQFPDDVVVYCEINGEYEIKVPAFETKTNDFSEIVETLREMYQDLI